MQPPQPEKAPKKAAAKMNEKKEKAVEPTKEAALDPVEEKLRQQRSTSFNSIGGLYFSLICFDYSYP